MSIELLLVNRTSSEWKVKRNLGTSNRWPCIVPKTCFQSRLGDVLRTSRGCPGATSWGHPESTFQWRLLDVISRRPQDVRLGRQFGTSPGWSNRIFIGRPRDALGTNICQLGIVKSFVNFKDCLGCYFHDLFTSMSVGAAVLPIMVRPNAILKSEFVNV